MAEESDPISQYVIAGSVCSVSATSFTKEVHEVNSEPIIIPASIIASVAFILLTLLMP